MTLQQSTPPEDGANKLALYKQQGYTVLYPTEIAVQVNPYYQMSVALVQLDPDPKSGTGDVYQTTGAGSFHNANEVSLSKNALNKIARACGLEWVIGRDGCRRLDDRSRPTYCEYEAVGRIRSFDGQWKTISGTKAIDLDFAKESGKQVSQAEKVHLLSHCETKAKLRAIREFLSVKQKYTREELAKPIAIPRLDFKPDFGDPEVRRTILLAGMGMQQALYGSGQQLALDAGEVHDAEARVQQMENGQTPTAATPAPQQEQTLPGGAKPAVINAKPTSVTSTPAAQAAPAAVKPAPAQDAEFTMGSDDAAAAGPTPEQVFADFKAKAAAATDMATLTALGKVSTANKTAFGSVNWEAAQLIFKARREELQAAPTEAMA